MKSVFVILLLLISVVACEQSPVNSQIDGKHFDVAMPQSHHSVEDGESWWNTTIERVAMTACSSDSGATACLVWKIYGESWWRTEVATNLDNWDDCDPGTFHYVIFYAPQGTQRFEYYWISALDEEQAYTPIKMKNRPRRSEGDPPVWPQQQ